MGNRSLYATLIGINAYKQNPLSGCIRDVLAIDLLLREQCSQQGTDRLVYEPKYFLAPTEADKNRIANYTKEQKIKTFSSALPTFKNISTQAFEHLKNAKEGDICVFYYSGHGSQTEAPPEFWHLKPTRQNETLVCLDSRDQSKPDARDLIDKELAYLLWDAIANKNVHAVIIMDCCHSGNNTRGMSEDIRSRYVVPSKTKIPFNKYLGFEAGNFYEIKNGKANIKIARYVHLAAAMDAEKAQESTDGGLFTSKLIEVLRSGGTAKSYRELMKTVGTTVRTRNNQQNPVAFALNDEDLDQQFLGAGIIPYKQSFEVRYYADRTNPQWRMYGGAIQGIVASVADAKTTVLINGSGNEVEVKEVFPSYSILDENGMNGFDKNDESYRASIARLAKKPLHIGISDELLADEKLLNNLHDAYRQKQFIHFVIHFEKQAENPDYYIHLLADAQIKNYVLTLPDNRIPLFKREKDAITFLNNLEKVGKWVNVSGIVNTNSRFTSESFAFEVEKLEGVPSGSNLDGMNWKKFEIQPDDEIVCSYVNNLPAIIKFNISIASPAKFDKVFVGALYMDCRFGISYNLVRPDESELRKMDGTALQLKTEEDGTIYNSIIVEFDEKFKSYNINEVTDTIKIFISNKKLELENFKQENLELDEKPASRGGTRGMGSRKDTATTEEDDWTVFTFKIRIAGPDKKKKLEPGRKNDFAAFNIDVPEGIHATAFAVTGDDIKAKQRVTNTRSLGEDDAKLTSSIAPAGIWGNAMTSEINFNKEIGSIADNNIEALELLPEQEGEELAIPEGKEIIISTANKTQPARSAAVTRSAQVTRSGVVSKPAETTGEEKKELDETIIPYGFDETSGLYFPLGYMDDAGKIHIQVLPPPTSGQLQDQQPATRSMGSSVKLFFKKILRKKRINTLALYCYDKKEGWEKVADDPKKMKSFLEIKPEGKALLLIHGITGDTKYMLEAMKEINELQEKADFILTYDYENLSTPVPGIADHLRTDLDTAGFSEENMPQLFIVAHSMGGLVSRWLIEKNTADNNIPVQHLILVGTPSAGSEVASLGKSALGMLTHALNVTGPVKYVITGLSFLLKKLELDPLKTLGELKPGSDTLKQLESSTKSNGTIYSIIGGDTSLLKKGYDGDDFFLKKLSEAIKNNIFYPGLTFSVFKEEANDMAVTIKSMEAIPGPGTTDKKIIASNHTGYFMDKECREQILKCLGVA